MNVSAERSKSYWQSSAGLPHSDRLAQNRTCDVIVVGSGIAGLSVAYELTAANLAVIVVDRGPLANGMTARTSAHLASHIDDGFDRLIRLRGAHEARLHYLSHAAAIDRAEHIQRIERIDCDFARIDGYLLRDPQTKADVFEAEFRAAEKVGFVGVEALDGAIRYPGQGRFHPLRYCYGLIEALRRRGVEFFGETIVEGVDEYGHMVTVRTSEGHTIDAPYAVVATNSPINDVVAIHTKQAPYRTYVFTADFPKGAAHDALYWDTADPYHYVRIIPRPQGSADLLLVGGEDHKSGQADNAMQRFAALEIWARTLFPKLGAIGQRWSGQVLEPVDCGAFIGLNPGNERVFVATGDSGQGLTHGIIAGLLISELVLGRDSPWRPIFDPKRKTVTAATEFLRENATVISNLAEHVTGGEIGSVEDLKPGQGAVIRQGLSKIAAYRAESGRLFVRSAVCTHVGCVVHWNSFEKCWDCPCHGSQFAPDGTALNGPAIKPLADATTPAREVKPIVSPAAEVRGADAVT